MTQQFLKQHNGNHSLDLYLSEIGKTPLIDAAEEVRLAGLIKQGDVKALEKLITSNLRFVVSVAKQYQGQSLPLADLIQEGNIGIREAAKRFDGSRGHKFISYAIWWIKRSILRALGGQGHIVRLPLNRVGELQKIGKAFSRLEQSLGRAPLASEIAKELGLSEGKVSDTLKISSPRFLLDSPFYKSEDNSLVAALGDKLKPSMVGLKEALDSLTPREAEVINLYFGLNSGETLTFKEIGKKISLGAERVRQIQVGAIDKLRNSDWGVQWLLDEIKRRLKYPLTN